MAIRSRKKFAAAADGVEELLVRGVAIRIATGFWFGLILLSTSKFANFENTVRDETLGTGLQGGTSSTPVHAWSVLNSSLDGLAK